MSTTKKRTKITIGLDLGDRKHTYCVLDDSGGILKEGTVTNEHEALSKWALKYSEAMVIMEAGTHSPWVSRLLSGLGMDVIVANPRKTRAIYQNERKSDRKDAVMLARLGRVDPALLHPIHHGSAQAQEDAIQIKLRDSLVRARGSLINSVRSTLKSLGWRVSNPSSDCFHKRVLAEVPDHLRPLIAPTVAALTELTQRIKELESAIIRLARERYPQTVFLQQVSGVGPITSLYFVLKIEDPARFARTRDVGAFLGLCPRRDQSGETDKALPITKAGDRYLRRLLVSAAQYTLGPFGAASALRDQGLKLAADGSPRAKKRAVIAVARKLSVLLLSLWKQEAAYEPYPTLA